MKPLFFENFALRALQITQEHQAEVNRVAPLEFVDRFCAVLIPHRIILAALKGELVVLENPRHFSPLIADLDCRIVCGNVDGRLYVLEDSGAEKRMITVSRTPQSTSNPKNRASIGSCPSGNDVFLDDVHDFLHFAGRPGISFVVKVIVILSI